jgi:hypothetical protein
MSSKNHSFSDEAGLKADINWRAIELRIQELIEEKTASEQVFSSENICFQLDFSSGTLNERCPNSFDNP